MKKYVCIFFFILVLIGFYQRGEPTIDIISDNYYFSYEQKAIIGKSELADIPPYVTEYYYDKDFVLVKQKPHYYKDDMYDSITSHNYINGLGEYYFWIIQLKNNAVFGPMMFCEFNNVCKQINIDEKLLSSLKPNESIDNFKPVANAENKNDSTGAVQLADNVASLEVQYEIVDRIEDSSFDGDLYFFE